MQSTHRGVRVQHEAAVKVADTKEVELALAFRRLIYSEELGHHGVDSADRTSVHYVAIQEGRVVAAMRVIGPTPLPLELGLFLGDLERHGRALQVGGLWSDRGVRRLTSASALIFKMFQLRMLELAHRLQVRSIYLRTHVQAVRGLYAAAGFRICTDLGFVHPLWGQVYTMVLKMDESRGNILSRRESAA